MEGNGTRMDYEDMFREITKKLYGEDPDHRSMLRFYANFLYRIQFSRIKEILCIEIERKMNLYMSTHLSPKWNSISLFNMSHILRLLDQMTSVE